MRTLHLEVIVTLVPAEEGGRSTPTFSGYRPPVWFGQVEDGGMERSWGFAFTFPYLDDDTPVPVGEPVVAQLRASVATFEDLPVRAGDVFEAREGQRTTARGRIVKMLET